MFSLRFCGWLCPITSEGVKSGIWASEGEILNAPLSTTATQAIYCKTACRHRDPLSYPVCCSCSCFYFYIRQTEAAACTQRTLPQSGGGGGYSHTLPIRVCAAQRGRDFEAPDLERGIHFRGVF